MLSLSLYIYMELEQLQILVSARVLEPIPCRYQGMTVLLDEKAKVPIIVYSLLSVF